MRNTIQTLVIVVIMFIICWSPVEFLWGLQYFGVITIDFSGWAFRLSILTQFSYCFINPLIYVIKYKDFKQGFTRMMLKMLPSKFHDCFIGPKVGIQCTGNTNVSTSTR
jgi:hypothetical protein